MPSISFRERKKSSKNRKRSNPKRHELVRVVSFLFCVVSCNAKAKGGDKKWQRRKGLAW